MPTLYLDIETGPAVYRSPEERRAATAKKVPANYSKPESIDKWIAENEDEIHGKTSLEALNGVLLVVGWCWDDPAMGSHTVYADIGPGDDRATVDIEEARTLRCLVALLRQQIETQCRAESPQHVAQFVTFRGTSFDIPWLMMRALRYRLPWLARVLPWHRYDRRNIDMYSVLAGPDYRGSPGSLDALSRYILDEGKADGLDGSQVWPTWCEGPDGRARVARYCQGDVELLRALHDRFVDIRGST